MNTPGKTDLEVVREIVMRGLGGIPGRVMHFGSRAKGAPVEGR